MMGDIQEYFIAEDIRSIIRSLFLAIILLGANPFLNWHSPYQMVLPL